MPIAASGQERRPDHTTVRKYLDDILASARFRGRRNRATRRARFLRFIVEETIAGHEESLKEYRIGIDVIGRPQDFDPQNDPIVRVEAGRLRQTLGEYYEREGRSDAIRIEIPKGGYIPEFSWSSVAGSKNGRDEFQEVAVEQAQRESEAPKRQGSHVLAPLLNVPARSRSFTGRDAYLEKVREALNKKGQAVAISGLGGIGKTQAAIEYVYRYRDHYETVLWSGADSPEAIQSGLAVLARRLNLLERDEPDLTVAVDSVRDWLESHSGWLLILDNVEDAAVVRPVVPAEWPGHVLITTQLRATADLAERIELPKMDPQEGAAFLLRRAKISLNDEPLDGPSSGLQIKLARQIAEEVDGLPLALDQAGAFIEETPSTLMEYLTLYHTAGAELRAQRGNMAADHPPVTKTFSICFASLSRNNPAAADLLCACAFLAPDAIPEEVFTLGGTHFGGALASACARPYTWMKAVADAGRFSLIYRNTAQNTFTMHRLVQDVLKDEMDAETRRSWAERVVEALGEVLPSPDKENRVTCERYILHVRTIAESIQKYGIETIEAGEVLHKGGCYLRGSSQYKEAGQLLRRGLNIFETVLGTEHQDTANILGSLAFYNADQGRYKEAEALLQRVLAIREKALGPEHEDTAGSLNELGVVKHLQGSHSEADLLFSRSITIVDKVLGSKHLSTYLSNYAKLLVDMARDAEAQQVNDRVAAIRATVNAWRDDSEKCNRVAKLIQGSALNDDIKAELLEDIRRWGLIDVVRNRVRFHSLAGLREIGIHRSVAVQLLSERERASADLELKMDHFDSKNEAVVSIRRGIAEGLYKDCVHLKWSRNGYKGDFVIVCVKDNFTCNKYPLSHARYKLICPKQCVYFHDINSGPEDF